MFFYVLSYDFGKFLRIKFQELFFEFVYLGKMKSVFPAGSMCLF